MTKLLLIFGSGKTFPYYSLRKYGVLFLFAVFTTLSAYAPHIDLSGKILEESSNVFVTDIPICFKTKGQPTGIVLKVNENFCLKPKVLPIASFSSSICCRNRETSVSRVLLRDRLVFNL